MIEEFKSASLEFVLGIHQGLADNIIVLVPVVFTLRALLIVVSGGRSRPVDLFKDTILFFVLFYSYGELVKNMFNMPDYFSYLIKDSSFDFRALIDRKMKNDEVNLFFFKITADSLSKMIVQSKGFADFVYTLIITLVAVFLTFAIFLGTMLRRMWILSTIAMTVIMLSTYPIAMGILANFATTVLKNSQSATSISVASVGISMANLFMPVGLGVFALLKGAPVASGVAGGMRKMISNPVTRGALKTSSFGIKKGKMGAEKFNDYRKERKKQKIQGNLDLLNTPASSLRDKVQNRGMNKNDKKERENGGSGFKNKGWGKERKAKGDARKRSSKESRKDSNKDCRKDSNKDSNKDFRKESCKKKSGFSDKRTNFRGEKAKESVSGINRENTRSTETRSKTTTTRKDAKGFGRNVKDSKNNSSKKDFREHFGGNNEFTNKSKSAGYSGRYGGRVSKSVSGRVATPPAKTSNAVEAVTKKGSLKAPYKVRNHTILKERFK